MTLFQNKFRIESSRIKDFDYSTPSWYYVTINTRNHVKWFGNIVGREMVLNSIWKIVNEEWLRTKEIRKNIDLDYFVIMPNHFHGIVIINGSEYKNVETDRVRLNNKNIDVNRDAFDASLRVRNCLSDIIRGFKSAVTKHLRENGIINFSWQSLFYDRIIRIEKELYKIRKYIADNPLKWEIERKNSENLVL